MSGLGYCRAPRLRDRTAIIIAHRLATVVRADTIVSLLAASLLLGILNAFLRPMLMRLALPLLILTLGLFTFVINALLLYLVANLVKGFHVSGFWVALKASVLISFVSLIASFAFVKQELPPRSRPRFPQGGSPPDTGRGPVIDV